ncbi:hypothetical protein GS575_28010 [Rhodococcus hoagii]|nr:hypothetical protein [Prescottella equi]
MLLFNGGSGRGRDVAGMYAPTTAGRDWHGRGVEYRCAPTTSIGEREDLVD